MGVLFFRENMNPFLKSYAVSLGEQVHIAAWPLYPDATTLKYPDPYTNISDSNSDASLHIPQNYYSLTRADCNTSLRY